ncbi:MAG: coaBC [Firmicutes bacterium]|nr:coaBC [Bacillota bacterium]
MLTGKKVVVGVSGGIAAYKAVEVVSRLKKAKAEVRVIMTRSATEFVTPLTFREISGNPVASDMWREPKTWNVEHIAMANWADLFLIVPATANIIGKMASGIADDMLSTTVMATKSPVMLAPAMNTNMYTNPVVSANLSRLAELGYYIIPPATGMLACGVEGPGRLPEPELIVAEAAQLFTERQTLAGKKVLVTAAGTREPIDPVRYIGNRSSGKMGYSLAAAAAKRGATVVLVSGPSGLSQPENVLLKKVETAAEMRQAVLAEYDDADIVIKAAAVADYRPSVVSEQKIKKNDGTITLVLEKTSDILAELGREKTHQILIGFAAETQDLLTNATVKLTKKNLDMIVANDVTVPGAGFDADTNIVRVLYRDGRSEELPQMSKESLAGHLLDKITALITNND